MKRALLIVGAVIVSLLAVVGIGFAVGLRPGEPVGAESYPGALATAGIVTFAIVVAATIVSRRGRS